MVNVCWGADIYVDASYGGGGNGDEATPWDTIQEAIADPALGDGNTIWVVGGQTYNEAVYNYLYFYNAVISNKSITIAAKPGTGTPTLATSNASRAIYSTGMSQGDTASVTIRNFTIAPTVGERIAEIRDEMSLHFDNCTITTASGCDWFIYALDLGEIYSLSAQAVRDFSITDCNITASLDHDLIQADHCRDVTITNLTQSGGTIGGLLFDLVGGINRNVTISDITFSGDDSSDAGVCRMYNSAETSTGYWHVKNVTGTNLGQIGTVLRGATFVRFYNVDGTITASSPSAGLYLGLNDVNEWSAGSTYSDSNTVAQDEHIFRCIQDVTVAGTYQPYYATNWTDYWRREDLGPSEIENCIINFTGDAVGKAHCFLLGKGCQDGGVLFYNNEGYNGNWGLVDKSNNATIIGNILYGANTMYANGGTHSVIANNSCYATSGFALGLGESQDETTPDYVRVYNNIFDASDGGMYSVNFIDDDGVEKHFNAQLNYNAYVSGSLGTFEADGAALTLAQMQTKWITWSNHFPDNDTNSIELTESVFRDPANGDFWPIDSIILWISGKPDLAGNGTEIGAISTFGNTDCPSADLTGDCFVNIEDFTILANEWLMDGNP